MKQLLIVFALLASPLAAQQNASDPPEIFYQGSGTELFLWQHRDDADCEGVGDDVTTWPGYNYTYYTRHAHLPHPKCTAAGVDFPGQTSVVMNSEQWPDGTSSSNLELAADVGQPYMFGAVIRVRAKVNPWNGTPMSTNGLFGGPHCGFNVNQGYHVNGTTEIWAEHASPKGRLFCQVNPNSYDWVYVLVCRFPDGSLGVNYNGDTSHQQWTTGDPSGVINSGFIGATMHEGEAFNGEIRTLVFARSIDFDDFDFSQQEALVEYLVQERDLAISLSQ